jgi:DNA-binding transcriptional LysR family regulator
MPRTPPETRISRRLRFHDLQVFFAVVQCGSMAKAAAELGVTQPAVSEVIAGLEDAFGIRLFDRSPQGAEPTIYGRALLKRGIAAFDELKQGIRDIEFLSNPSKGEVRIGCSDAITGTVLAPVVQQLCRDYPDISITIEPVTSTLELPELHSRKMDFVVTRLSKPHADDPFGAALNVEVLFDDAVVIAAGANSRWGRRRKIAFADLLDAAWVGTSRQALTTTLVARAFQAKNLPVPKLRVMTYSVQLRARLLATGDFLTALPRSMLRLNPEFGSVKQLSIKLPDPGFPVAIVTLKDRTLTPAVELFLDTLRGHIKSLA